MYNKAFLIGNLTRDPELRYTPSGLPVARFTLAVNRVQKKGASEADGRQTVDFINVVAWRRLAEICGEYLKKGSSVAVEGYLQIRSYEKDGEKRQAAEVVADGMQMLSRRQGGMATGETAGASETNDEIPF
jgi:single-strand DNA-binding protein